MSFRVNTSFPIAFEKVNNYHDSRFTFVKIYLCHVGENLNNSYFSKEVLTRMSDSLGLIPILGYISSDNYNGDDFNGHESRIIIEENGIKYEYIGRPYGVILENHNARFENKLCDDGVTREFLVCDGALWNKFTDCVDIFNRDGVKSQSMELEPSSIKGEYKEDRLFHFSQARVEGACILGEGVIPAMTGSTIEKYSLNKNSIINEFSKMMLELKFSLTKSTSIEDDINNKYKQGGNKVDKILEMLARYNVTIDELQAKGINHEDFSLEELEEKVKTEFTQTNEDVKSGNTDDKKQSFALTGSQLFEEVAREITAFGNVDFYGYEFPRYALVDVDTENGKVITQDYENWYLVGFDYSMSGDKVNIDKESVKRFKVSYSPMELDSEANFSTELFKKFAEEIKSKTEEKVTSDFRAKLTEKDNELSNQSQKYNELQEQFIQVSEKYTTKIQEERETKEAELFSSFSAELTDEEMKEVKEKKSDYSLEELQDKLFALVGKKKAKFSFDKKPEVIDLNTEEARKKKSGKSYDVLFEQD